MNKLIDRENSRAQSRGQKRSSALFGKFKRSSLLLSLPALLSMPSVFAISCPAGTNADSLVWEDVWTGGNDLVFTPQTFTSTSGDVDLRVTVNTTAGSGCTNSHVVNLHRLGYYALEDDNLAIGVDWPNRNCQVTFSLEAFLDGTITPINLNRLEYTLSDLDYGKDLLSIINPPSWVDKVIYSPAPTLRTNGPGSSFDQTATVTEANISRCANVDLADFGRCRQTVRWDGPLAEFEFAYASGSSAELNPDVQEIFISNIEFCTPSSLPVSLSSFSAEKKRSGNLSVKWETASELANAGFMLWGERNNEWVLLSQNIVPSKKTTGHNEQRYQANVRLDESLEGVKSVAISSIDTGGEEQFFGPFLIGDEYGESTIPEPIDWSRYQAAFAKRMKTMGYQAHNNSWRKSSAKLKSTRFGVVPVAREKVENQPVFLSVDGSGLFRVTGQDLIDLGWTLQGINSRDIAVTRKGISVARDLSIANTGPRHRNNKFGAEDSIVFFAQALSGEDTIYLDSSVFQISLDRQHAEPAELLGRNPVIRGQDNAYAQDRHVFTIAQDNIHNVAVKAANPWVMHEFFTYYGETEESYLFSLADISAQSSANLKLVLHTVSDFPALLDPDTQDVIDEHRVIVKVNGAVVADETTNDTVSWPLDIDFDSALLLTGDNLITVEVPGVEGYYFDIVLLDSIALTVDQALDENAPHYEFSAQTNRQGHLLKNNFGATNNLVAYAYNDEGGLVKPRARFKSKLLNSEGKRVPVVMVADASRAGSTSPTYFVGPRSAIAKPNEMWLKSSSVLDINAAADYVIIVEDSLSEDLDRFVEHRQANGYTVAAYRFSDIVDEYGFGYRTPESIKRFIQELSETSPLTHVLLVGGHTFDYLNNSNAAIAPVNFIPAFYRTSSDLIHSTPTDLPFVDLDDDGAPELAIGRWPVRDALELATIIDKTIAFDTASNNGDFGFGANQKALFVAEQEASELYKSINQSIAQGVGARANDGSLSEAWENISYVNVDDYLLDSGSTVEPNSVDEQAREDIIQYLNSGQKLTVFTGHGSPVRWSNQNLFTTESIQALDNSALPTSIITLACYTTYYESLTTNTLAHQFLFSGGGAAMLMGAPMLGETLAIRSIIDDVVNQTMQGATVGEASMRALQKSIASGDGAQTTINWSILGDPAIRLNH